MNAVKHKIVHQYQPTETTCSPTALAMLLSHYDIRILSVEVEAKVPQTKDKDGKDSGTVTQLLAAWTSTQGFKVCLYTFDCQIIDQSWAGLKSEELRARLNAGMNGWIVPALGQEWSRAYRQAYIDYLKDGNELIIEPAVTTKLLYKLLKKGPLFTNVCINTLYGRGRTQDSKLDDVDGRTWNHSIVIYGNDEKGNFLIADPIIKPGLHTIEPERMIAAITAAQIECDNLLFQISK